MNNQIKAVASREMIDAAIAVIERWDSPLWKDLPHTADYIHRLRKAVAAIECITSMGEPHYGAEAMEAKRNECDCLRRPDSEGMPSGLKPDSPASIGECSVCTPEMDWTPCPECQKRIDAMNPADAWAKFMGDAATRKAAVRVDAPDELPNGASPANQQDELTDIEEESWKALNETLAKRNYIGKARTEFVDEMWGAIRPYLRATSPTTITVLKQAAEAIEKQYIPSHPDDNPITTGRRLSFNEGLFAAIKTIDNELKRLGEV